MTVSWIICSAFLALVSGCAFGTIIPIEQRRTINATVEVFSGGVLKDYTYAGANSPDFAVFDSSYYLDAAYVSGSIRGAAHAQATQRSAIDSAGIHVYDLLAYTQGAVIDTISFDTFARATASSFFRVVFDVTQGRRYDLVTLHPTISGAGDLYVELLHGTAVLARLDSVLSAPLDLPLYLAPGTYELRASASSSLYVGPGNSNAGTGFAEFHLTESVPEPGSAALFLLGSGVLALWRTKSQNIRS